MPSAKLLEEWAWAMEFQQQLTPVKPMEETNKWQYLKLDSMAYKLSSKHINSNRLLKCTKHSSMQLNLFSKLIHMPSKSLVNHSTTWAKASVEQCRCKQRTSESELIQDHSSRRR